MLSFADGRVGVGLLLALLGLFYGLSRLVAARLGLLLQEGLKGSELVAYARLAGLSCESDLGDIVREELFLDTILIDISA